MVTTSGLRDRLDEPEVVCSERIPSRRESILRAKLPSRLRPSNSERTTPAGPRRLTFFVYCHKHGKLLVRVASYKLNCSILQHLLAGSLLQPPLQRFHSIIIGSYLQDPVEDRVRIRRHPGTLRSLG